MSKLDIKDWFQHRYDDVKSIRDDLYTSAILLPSGDSQLKLIRDIARLDKKLIDLSTTLYHIETDINVRGV